MIFTASDVESLSHWEWAEYIFEGFVIVACAGELVADLGAKWLTEERKKHLERRSTILLVVALSLSLICLVRTNELSGSVIGSLGGKADEADKKAKAAITDSSTALTTATDALTKAGAARKEADSFEQDIVSAKEKSAKAEERTLRAERSLLQFQEKIQSRHLSDQQKQDLVRRLSKVAKAPFMVARANDAVDGQIYGEDFIDVFTRLGWSPGPKNTMVVWLSKHTIGVFVEVHDLNDETVPQATSFLKALRESGVAANPSVNDSVPQHLFTILIGAKE